MNRGACLILLAMFCSAGAKASGEANALANAKERYPATAIHAVRPTPLPGIYEFDFGSETAYGDRSARYLIFGRLVDMEAIAKPASAIDYDAAAAISFAVQTGTDKEIIVFSDPHCPYCAELERRLEANLLPHYTIRIILVPLLAGSAAAAARILCAAKPAAAYRGYLLDSEALPADCANGLAQKHFAAAKQAGIAATPSLLAPSGAILTGLPTAAELLAWAEANQGRSSLP